MRSSGKAARGYGRAELECALISSGVSPIFRACATPGGPDVVPGEPDVAPGEPEVAPGELDVANVEPDVAPSRA